jgi:hypothetical protein
MSSVGIVMGYGLDGQGSISGSVCCFSTWQEFFPSICNTNKYISSLIADIDAKLHYLSIEISKAQGKNEQLEHQRNFPKSSKPCSSNSLKSQESNFCGKPATANKIKRLGDQKDIMKSVEEPWPPRSCRHVPLLAITWTSSSTMCIQQMYPPATPTVWIHFFIGPNKLSCTSNKNFRSRITQMLQIGSTDRQLMGCYVRLEQITTKQS